MNPTPPVNRSGANLRAILVITAAVISAAMADQTLRETAGPLAISLLSLVSVAALSWRQWLDTTSGEVRQNSSSARIASGDVPESQCTSKCNIGK